MLRFGAPKAKSTNDESETPSSSSSTSYSPRASSLYLRDADSTQFALPEGYKGPLILVLTADQASTHTKVPIKYLKKLNKMFTSACLLYSIRVQEIFSGANRQYDLLFDFDGSKDSDDIDEHEKRTFGTKDTRTQTKTNRPGSICDGNLPRDSEDRTTGLSYKLMDNNLAGAFHQDTVSVSQEESNKIKKLCSYPDEQVKKVKNLNGLICFSVDVPGYDKDGKGDIVKNGNRVTKHYIQATESLRRIALKMDRGNFAFAKIKDGYLYFTDNGKDANQNRPVKRINLRNLIPKISDEVIEKITKVTDENSFISFIIENKLLKHSAPLEKIRLDSNKVENFIPLVVQASDEGLAITSDTDMQHIGILPGLPKASHRGFYCKTTLSSDILQQLQELENQLSPWEEYKNTKLKALNKEQISSMKTIYEAFKDGVTEMYKHYRDPDNTDKLQLMGGSTVYSLVMEYICADPLWVHGPEDMHPMEVPEEFSGILSCWNGKYIVTGNEKAYLDFLFHDPNILKIQEIGVHPYWLQAPGEGKKPSGTEDLSKDWLNLIEAQALNKYYDYGEDNALEFLDYLSTRITDVKVGIKPRANNDQAVQKISKLAELVKGLGSKQNAKSKLDKIYKDYKAKSEQSFSILERESFHALNMGNVRGLKHTTGP